VRALAGTRSDMATELTVLLRAAQARDPDAVKRLFEIVYGDLKRLAHSNLRHGSGLEELNTTALVHESFLKYMEHGMLAQADRPAFFAYVGRVMRNVVIDFVRERQAQKRGGDRTIVTLDTGIASEAVDDQRLLAIHAALVSLEKLSPPLMELVEMRYFAGLTVPEISTITGRSTRTIEREWDKARALLRKLMNED
jgi:RNA polymerase sigma factor (TIGR02999 family)